MRKKNNVLTAFFIFYKNNIETFLKQILNQYLKCTRQHDPLVNNIMQLNLGIFLHRHRETSICLSINSTSSSQKKKKKLQVIISKKTRKIVQKFERMSQVNNQFSTFLGLLNIFLYILTPNSWIQLATYHSLIKVDPFLVEILEWFWLLSFLYMAFGVIDIQYRLFYSTVNLLGQSCSQQLQNLL